MTYLQLSNIVQVKTQSLHIQRFLDGALLLELWIWNIEVFKYRIWLVISDRLKKAHLLVELLIVSYLQTQYI